LTEHPVVVEVELNGVPVRLILGGEAIGAIAAAIAPAPRSSLYLTIPEAAEYLRANRQRVDDLLSQRRLRRVKDGARTLIRRADLVAYLNDGGQPRRET
jgi:excisionase family DNA binding protein